MVAAPANPDHVEPGEIEAMRREIRAVIAVRATGIELRPIDDLILPEWVRGILRAIVFQIRLAYPDGIPGDRPDLVARYIDRAVRLFDDELPLHFELTSYP